MGTKPRLITFGCSYTYGIGLPDIKTTFITGKPRAPSKIGWAALLAQKLGVELVNVSYPGSSNIEILYNILTFEFKKDDVVVVMWTHPIRDIMFDKWTHIMSQRRRLGFWWQDKESAWENQVSIKDYIIKTWMSIHHADLFLKSKNIKYIHYPFDISEYNDYTVKGIAIDNLHKDGFMIVDRTDDHHPAIESNRLTCENIFRILNAK
jgi:hypothetical protein